MAILRRSQQNRGRDCRGRRRLPKDHVHRIVETDRETIPETKALIFVVAFALALFATTSDAPGATSPGAPTALGLFGQAFELVLKRYYVAPDSTSMLAAAHEAMIDKYLPGDKTLPRWKPDARGDVFRGLTQFGDAFEQVRKRVRVGTSDSDLIGAAIGGMLQSLNSNNAYYDPETYRNIQQNWRSEFGGIGVEIAKEGDVARVVAPLDGSPAALASIMAGDVIVAIDGVAVAELSLTEIVNRIRGPVGAAVKLTIRRQGASQSDVPVVRNTIQLKLTSYEIIEGVGYVRLSSLNGKAADAVQQAFASLANSARVPLRGYVLDLRNNPGGLLDQAVAVADLFIYSGEIVAIRDRGDTVERRNARTGRGVDLPSQPVVLVNNGTAGGAEIVAAALQDHQTAIVVGGQTFGNGLSGTVFPLGDGAIRLVTAQYFRPSGKALHRNGVTPDQTVRSDPAIGSAIPVDRVRDRQLQHAIALITGKSPDPAGTPPGGAGVKGGGSGGNQVGFDELEDLGTLE